MSAVADVLTHVLVGYIIGMLLSFKYEWMGPAHVTLVVIGALSPDFMKVGLFFRDEFVASVLGVPFSWAPLHTFVGSVLVICLATLLLAPEYRKAAIVLITLGVTSHHVLDILLLTPSSYAYAGFWPIFDYRPPSGGLYLSTDRWPLLVAGTISVLLWIVGHYLRAQRTETSTIG